MPVRKMIVFVPIIDQMNVMASAASALYSDASMSVWTEPRPMSARNWFSVPFAAKNWSATMPMTTQDIAVGRK